MSILPQNYLSFGTSNYILQIHRQYSSFCPQIPSFTVTYSSSFHPHLPSSSSAIGAGTRRFQQCAASVRNADAEGDSESSPESKSKAIRKGRPKKNIDSQTEPNKVAEPTTTATPRKQRRGRKSEADAVQDFVRGSLEKTFASIREQNPDVLINKKQVLKEGNGKIDSDVRTEDDDDYDDEFQTDQKMVVDDDNPDWPADADVGWGVRASDYFEKHAIRNVVGDDGSEIDWEGEIDNSWVQEINCLEWESFAFHPSPLIVLVFERYNRATDNWKTLKELEKALHVYWNAKDRLPPRAVKLDVNIEKDLAYALKVRQCPQILFLRGQRVLYREKELRTADELVQMIAYFYYKARKPPCINDAALSV